MSESLRLADVNQLAFAIVHALEDRDSGLTAEIDALRSQVAALSEAGRPNGGSSVDLTVLEAVVEREPELRQELNGAFEQALIQARGGEDCSPGVLMPLLALSIAQALRRRDAELGGALRQVQQQVSELSQQVATIARALGTAPPTVDNRSELGGLRDVLATELGALRQQLVGIEAGAAKAARSRAASPARRRGTGRAEAGNGTATETMPLSELRMIVDVLRRGGSEFDGQLEVLRQLGYERAVTKSGDPKIDVSPVAALLLGVAELVEAHEARQAGSMRASEHGVR